MLKSIYLITTLHAFAYDLKTLMVHHEIDVIQLLDEPNEIIYSHISNDACTSDSPDSIEVNMNNHFFMLIEWLEENSESKNWHNSDVNAEGNILHLTPNGSINIYSINIKHSNGFNEGARDCNINIIDSNIASNEADHNRGNILLKSVQFYDNTADDNSGVLNLWNVNVIAKDVNWTENTATDYGATIIASDSTFDIENSQWTANQAAAAAAFQCFWNCEFDYINCTFENNISIDGFGGLIFVFTTIIMLSHVEIINRSADTTITDNLIRYESSAFGGSLYFVDSDIYIYGGMVTGFGGCMYGWNSKFDIINSYLDSTEADGAGGVLYIGNSALNISNSEIINNELPSGSCICTYKSQLLLTNMILKSNVADGLAGCLFVNASYLRLLDSNALYNYAPNGNGSVLQIEGIDELISGNNIESSIDVNNCELLNKRACAIFFNVTFNIMENDCINPIISIDYEAVDYAAMYWIYSLQDCNVYVVFCLSNACPLPTTFDKRRGPNYCIAQKPPSEKPQNNSFNNKIWLNGVINNVSYDKHRLLTPQFVKNLSKTLILMVNIIICETTNKNKSNTIRNYFKSNDAFNMVLLYTLIQLLGTYVLPETIHCKSLELSFHSNKNIVIDSKSEDEKHKSDGEYDNENENKNDIDVRDYRSHNDMKQYISGNRWRMTKSAQITIQFHRLLIKCLWILINDILLDNNIKFGNKIYDMLLNHSSQRVILLQLMHFSVLSFECSLNLLKWLCNKTYKYKEQHFNSNLLYNFVYNLGLAFVTLCDEYQLEGNEFKVHMFQATLTTEDDDINSNNNSNNEINSIIPNSKEKSKYINECGKKYAAYFANVFRFANSVDPIYTFHVKDAIAIILPLISLCIKVRDQVMARKQVIEFLKELFYVILPQSSYLFIRFQYEDQYSFDEMIPILIKSRSGFNKDIILTFYENENKSVTNCLTALPIFLYLGDIDGISCKTIIKNLDRLSKREWRNYIHYLLMNMGINQILSIQTVIRKIAIYIYSSVYLTPVHYQQHLTNDMGQIIAQHKTPHQKNHYVKYL